MRLTRYFRMPIILIVLSGCTAIFVSDKPDPSIYTDRRPADEILMDTALEIRLKKKFNELSLLKGSRVSVHCFNRHVLLTGRTDHADHLNTISALVLKQEGVKQIYNEISVGPALTPLQRLQDSWITTKIKAAMYTTPDLKPWRLQVLTENGVVYLIGIVKNAEAEAAVQVASTTDGVTKVVKIFERID